MIVVEHNTRTNVPLFSNLKSEWVVRPTTTAITIIAYFISSKDFKIGVSVKSCIDAVGVFLRSTWDGTIATSCLRSDFYVLTNDPLLRRLDNSP